MGIENSSSNSGASAPPRNSLPLMGIENLRIALPVHVLELHSLPLMGIENPYLNWISRLLSVLWQQYRRWLRSEWTS